jgi:hypothetical protein
VPTQSTKLETSHHSLGGGGGVTGACYALSRLFEHPYDGWLIGFGVVSAIVTTAFLFHDFDQRRRVLITVVAAALAALVLICIWIWTENRRNQRSQADDQFRISEQPIVTVGKKDGTIAAVDETGVLRLYFLNSGHLPALNFSVISLFARGMPFMPIRRTYRKDGSIDDGPRPHEVTIATDSIYPAPLVLSPEDLRNHTVVGIFLFPLAFQYCDRFGQYVCKSVDLFAGVGPKGFGPFQIEGEVDCYKSVFAVFMPPNEPKITAPPCPQLS